MNAAQKSRYGTSALCEDGAARICAHSSRHIRQMPHCPPSDSAESDYGGRIYHVIDIIELRVGKMFRSTRYYADPFNAPAWRAQWVERLNT